MFSTRPFEVPSQRLFIPERQKQSFEVPSEAVRDTISAFYDMTPLQSDSNRGFCRAQHWCERDCIFIDANLDMATVHRTRSQSEHGAHLVFVHRYLSGSLRGNIGDFVVDRDPGSVCIFDMSPRVECIQFPVDIQGIYVPKRILGYESARHAPLIKISTLTPTGRTLDRELDQIFQSLGAHDMLDLGALERLFAVLKIAIGSDQQDGDVRQLARLAMRQTIQTYIEQTLDSPDLSVEHLLRNFAVSRASLYRMFDPYGGVRQYISNRRLYRAVLELSGKELRRGDIVEVSDKWGFSSHANFHRSVKREFGASPGALVGAGEIDALELGIREGVYAFTRQTLEPELRYAQARA